MTENILSGVKKMFFRNVAFLHYSFLLLTNVDLCGIMCNVVEVIVIACE